MKKPVETVVYVDPDGNVLKLRRTLSPGSIRHIAAFDGTAAANTEDLWARRMEMLFEHLTVVWDIAGLPLEEQKMLVGRYRMANDAERKWVQATISRHLEDHIPELS